MTQITITLSPEDSAFLDELVKRGAFPSPEAALTAGIEELRLNEAEPSYDEPEIPEGMTKAEFDQWLKQEILPVIEAIDRGECELIPAEEVWRDLLAHHNQRVARTRS